MNLTAFTPPQAPPDGSRSTGNGPFDLIASMFGAAQQTYSPFAWVPFVVVAALVIGVIAVGVAWDGHEHKIQLTLAAMTGEPKDDDVIRAAARHLGRRRLRAWHRWAAFGAWAAIFAASVILAASTTITLADPWVAWTKNAAGWAKDTYGVTGGIADLTPTKACAIDSTNPCLEATVFVGHRVELVQLAYPSGVPVLVSTSTKQTLPLIGAAK